MSRKFIIPVILIIAIAAIYFLYPEILGQFTPDFQQVFSAQPIPFSQEQDLHFY